MDKLETNLINIYGDRGRDRINSLADTVDTYAHNLCLSELLPVSNMTYNFVLAGWRLSEPIILKMSLEGFTKEAAALKAFQHFGAVGVLALEKDVMLLQRAVPGTSLKSYFPDRDQESVEIACGVIKKLHSAPIPASHPFPHIKDWLKTLDNSYAGIEGKYLFKAQNLRNKLIATATKDILLHGDLHHDNILKNGDSWVVIDPKGVIGEAEYEVAAFIRNPIPELMNASNAKDIVDKRIRAFAQTPDFAEDRVRDWCFVQGVLSMIWAIEDGGDVEYFRQVLKCL
jgi:streptomycin 6-kinase